MRKLITVLLALMLLMALAGCQSNAAAANISADEAQAMALKHAGVTADQVTRLHTVPDRDDGVFHYDVEFHHGGFEYDYEIDAKDGSLLKADKEKD